MKHIKGGKAKTSASGGVNKKSFVDDNKIGSKSEENIFGNINSFVSSNYLVLAGVNSV